MFLGLTTETWIAMASVGLPLLAHIFGKVSLPGLPVAPVVTPVAPVAPSNTTVLSAVEAAAVAAFKSFLSQAANPSGNPPVKV